MRGSDRLARLLHLQRGLDLPVAGAGSPPSGSKSSPVSAALAQVLRRRAGRSACWAPRPRPAARPVHEGVQRRRRRSPRCTRSPAGPSTMTRRPTPLLVACGEILDLARRARGTQLCAAHLQERLGLLRALLLRALHDLLRELLVVHGRRSLSRPSSRPRSCCRCAAVGRPTPTGTLCPSLPQVPMPGSGIGSQPTRDDVLQRLRAHADQHGVLHRPAQLARSRSGTPRSPRRRSCRW